MADMEFEDVDGGKRTCGISERPNGVETSSGMQSMTRTGRSISAIHQLRKSNKPLMEKRRRERINNCLDQLKSILMEVTKKESSYYSKLEKADILEMTVKYLKNLKRQHTMMATRAAPTVAASGIANENRHPQACSILVDRVTSATIDDDEFETGLGFDFKIPPFDVSAKESLSRYMAGYSECASEVSKYLASADTPMPAGDGCNDRNRKVLSDAALDDEARNCLLGHLANNLSWSKAVAAVAAAKSAPSLPSFPVGRPLNSSSPDTTSPAATVSGSGKLTTRDYQSAPQTKCSEAVSGSPLTPTLTPTSASYRTGDLAVNSHGPATSATKPVSSSPLQVVVPARLSSGEVIYVLASPISNIAAATDLPNSPIADNVELSSLGVKSTSGIVLPVVAQQAGNGSDGSKPAAGDDGRGGSFIRGPNRESLTYFRSTTSPSAVAPLDFSRSSVKNANSVRQQPILAGSPSQLTENGLSQSQRVLVNDQIVLRWTGHVGQTMNGCVTTDNEDLMNNNDPCFQSMWRPW